MLSLEPYRYEWPGLPPEAMLMFGSMLPPRAMSGSKALLQSGSVLMFETQVTIKGFVDSWFALLPEALLLPVGCAAAGAHVSTPLNYTYQEKLMLTPVLSTVIQKPEFANIVFIVKSANIDLLNIYCIYPNPQST